MVLTLFLSKFRIIGLKIVILGGLLMDIQRAVVSTNIIKNLKIDKNMEKTFPVFGSLFKVALELALFGAIFYIICFQEKSETDITALFMFALLLTIMTIIINMDCMRESY